MKRVDVSSCGHDSAQPGIPRKLLFGSTAADGKRRTDSFLPQGGSIRPRDRDRLTTRRPGNLLRGLSEPEKLEPSPASSRTNDYGPLVRREP